MNIFTSDWFIGITRHFHRQLRRSELRCSALVEQIELRSWRIAIWLLARRRFSRLGQGMFFVTLLLIPCFLLLPTISSTANFPGRSPAALVQPADDQVALAAEPNGQKNLLVLVVDRLDRSKPHLQGIWLVLELPGRPRLTLVPVFPAALQDSESLDARLTAQFKLGVDNAPGPEFFQVLRELDFWWDHYFVIDQTGLNQLTHLAIPQTATPAPAANIPAAGPTSPRGRLMAQASLFKSLCDHSLDIAMTLQPTEIIAQLGDNFRSDFPTNQIDSSWSEIYPFMRGMICEFPTLPEFAPTPIAR